MAAAAEEEEWPEATVTAVVAALEVDEPAAASTAAKRDTNRVSARTPGKNEDQGVEAALEEVVVVTTVGRMVTDSVLVRRTTRIPVNCLTSVASSVVNPDTCRGTAT